MRRSTRTEVSITELRRNLASYLAEAREGHEIAVTSKGRVIARIVPSGSASQEARERLIAARRYCTVGDVVRPSGERWRAED